MRSTSAAFGMWAAEALAAHATEEPAEDTELSVVVADPPRSGRRARPFHILYRGTLQVIRSHDLDEVARSLIGELARMTLSERDDHVYIEGGLLWRGDAVALIPGTSITYVHTIGQRVNRAGYQLGDQTWIAVNPETGRVVVPQGLVGVDEAAFSGLAELSPPARPDRRRLRGSLAPPVVCAMSWEQGVSELSPAGGVHRLATHTMNLPRMQQRGLDGLARLVRDARCFAVGTGGAQDVLDGFGVALTCGTN
jgi:hypothetical protein